VQVPRTLPVPEMTDGRIILQGIVGSTAYGLAREGSDVDRLGVFVAPTEEFLGLNPPVGKRATMVQHEPSDLTLHEVGKFCSLALQCNPTILELLWLPDELIETRTYGGYQLRDRRGKFLSRQRVRDAYFGYATQQFDRLSNRSRFPDVPVNRIAKHARHLKRLLYQGFSLYQTGTMSVQVRDPHEYFEFGERVASGDLDVARMFLDSYEQSFDAAKSPLPEAPDAQAVENYLRETRKALL
jgi:predicted nucleotidyltransferase